MADNLVLTPGGFRDKSLVYKVESGQAVSMTDDKASLMDLKTGRESDFPPAKTQAQAATLGGGWICFGGWTNDTGAPIFGFSTTWTVPQPPTTNSGQTIFLFNGIQNNAGKLSILQPVLQWSTDPDGSAYWRVANWYVFSGGPAYHGTFAKVNSGDTLVGMITRTGFNNGIWSYSSNFIGIEQTVLNITTPNELDWCCETLEAYNVEKCSDYPASDSTVMGQVQLVLSGKPAPLNWTLTNNIVDCGQHASIANAPPLPPGVELHYR